MEGWDSFSTAEAASVTTILYQFLTPSSSLFIISQDVTDISTLSSFPVLLATHSSFCITFVLVLNSTSFSKMTGGEMVISEIKWQISCVWRWKFQWANVTEVKLHVQQGLHTAQLLVQTTCVFLKVSWTCWRSICSYEK